MMHCAGYRRSGDIKGFTLIELSIVLVVIGLIVGGVLVGKELHHNSKLVGQINQIQEYNSAMSSFKTKYSCYPGDCEYAVRLGLGTHTTNHQGSGDDRIGRVAEGCIRGGSNPDMEEIMNVFMHLQRAGMVKDSVTFEGYQGEVSCLTPSMTARRHPRSRLNSNAFVIASYNEVWHSDMATYGVFLRSAGNSYGIGGIHSTHNWAFNPIIRTEDSYQIDLKIDDGRPLTGKVGLAPVGDPWSSLSAKKLSGGPHNCINATYKNIIDSCPSNQGGKNSLLIFLNQY